MFKQHVNLMICTWILRHQTALRNEFPCKNGALRVNKKTADGRRIHLWIVGKWSHAFHHIDWSLSHVTMCWSDIPHTSQ